MHTIEKIDQDIERCQGQIAKTFENDYIFENQDHLIIREGFQRNLKFLLNERRLHTTAPTELNNKTVIGATVVLPNGSEQPFMYGRTFAERAFQTCNFSIQQTKQRRT